MNKMFKEILGKWYVRFRASWFPKFMAMRIEISNFNNCVWNNVFFEPFEVRDSYTVNKVLSVKKL